LEKYQPSTAAEKSQQRPEKLEKPHHEFPDSPELIPIPDTGKYVEHHVGPAHGALRLDAGRYGKRP
jgi:hypothetical protein